MKSFESLGLSKPILQAIKEKGFTEPTEIQEKSIPLVLEGKDVMGAASTGSGKTLAFGAAVIRNCVAGGKIQALILTPTRELAIQVSSALKEFSKHKKLYTAVIYGGVGYDRQIMNLRRSEIVVGTPGRLLDHLHSGEIDLSQVNTLVLDEADRMLDMGFIDDVRELANACKKERQTLLFSATLRHEIVPAAKTFMNNPVMVNVEEYVDPSMLKQVYYDVEENMKFSLLVHLLRHEHAKLVMVFCNSRKTVDFVTNNLRANDLDAIAIHGGLSQEKRERVLSKFHASNVQVLCCTDVAARGLDIPQVTHVYNYDAPNESKQYVHRIGRTARAGKEGKAINLVSQRDHDNFGWVLEDNKVEVEKLKKPYVNNIPIRWRETPKRGGPRGHSRDHRPQHHNRR